MMLRLSTTTGLTVAAVAIALAATPISALVTKDDVAQLIEAPVTSLNENAEACEYHTADPGVYVTIRLVSGRRAQAAMSGAAGAAKMFGGGGARPPALFGSDAVYGMNDQLAFLANGVFVSIMPPMARARTAQNPAPRFLSDADKRAIANALGDKLLRRLGK